MTYTMAEKVMMNDSLLRGLIERSNTNIAYLSLSKSMAISKGWSDVVLDQADVQIGTGLIAENGYVRIGKGIKYVKVSASLSFNICTANDAIYLAVFKNGSIVNYIVIHAKNGYLHSESLVPFVVSVNEGDIIQMRTRNEAAARGILNEKTTYMTVESVGGGGALLNRLFAPPIVVDRGCVA